MPAIVDPSTMDYMEMKGNVHSTESLACLEGPGNRFLLFLNGYVLYKQQLCVILNVYEY